MNGRLKKAFAYLDLSLFRDSALLTVGMVLARGIGFVVTMLQARLFRPSDFGVIQYAVSLAGILAMVLQPFGQHVLSRYIGMLREFPPKLNQYLTNFWLLFMLLFVASFVIATPILWLLGDLDLGVLVIFFGLGIYYAYYGLARGFLASGRLVLLDVGSNLLQVLLILVLIQSLQIHSTMLAKFIQGLACLVPIILLQKFHPLSSGFDRSLFDHAAISTILRFALPIWVSHASYILYSTIAVLFLKHYTDTATVGVFTLATTLSVVVSFIPNGLATFLMPRVAGEPDKRHRRLMLNAVGVAGLSGIALIIVYYIFAPWLVSRLFGPGYLIYPQIFFLMAIWSAMGGIHHIITSVFVGKGRASEEAKSRLAALAFTLLGSWLFIPSLGLPGAVFASMLGVLAGLLVYGMIYLQDRRRARR